jgi:hypothetical protein
LLVLCLYAFIANDTLLVKSVLLPLLAIVALVIMAIAFFVEALREFLVPRKVTTANEQAASDEKPKRNNPANPRKKI